MVGRMSTQLGDYYDALCDLKEQEMTALAELHADDPSLLVHRFRHSVKAVQRRAEIDAPFYPERRDDAAPPRSEIKSTIEFARHLFDGRGRHVENEPALTFRYVDREIFPGRTGVGKTSGPRRSLDLLLASAQDDLPVLAELKIRGDKPSYFALIQVLMLAVELQSPEQRSRLLKHQQGMNLRFPETGPFVDLYIIAFEPPTTGAYRVQSYDATSTISKKLMEDALVTSYVRRIAYLEATLGGGELTFKKKFAYGAGMSH